MRLKKKIGIVLLLLVIALFCFGYGQMTVKKPLFDVDNAFAADIVGDGKERTLVLDSDHSIETEFNMGDAYVTLMFTYEVVLPEGKSSFDSTGNFEIDIIDQAMPENTLRWALEPGKLKAEGKMQVDLKAFKGKRVIMKIISTGEWPEGANIIFKDIYLSKLYTGA